MTTKTFVSGNAVGGTWSPAGDPAASDDDVFDGSSGSCVLNSSAVARSVVCTGYTNTISGSAAWGIGDGTTGNFTLVAGMGWTSTSTITFKSTTTGNQITSAGKTLGAATFNGGGGAWTLQDAFAVTNVLTLTTGTLVTGNQNVSCSTVTNSGSSTRAITLGSSTVTCSGVGPWNCSNGRSTTSSGLTVSAGTSTIAMTYAGASDGSFIGGGNTYYDVLVTTGGTGKLSFNSSDTFHAIRVTGSTAKTLLFTAGTTQTITGATGLPSGVSGFLITLNSVTSGSKWTLNLSGQVLSIDYVSVKDLDVTNGTLYCGANSTDSGNNNASVIFSVPPSNGTALASMVNVASPWRGPMVMPFDASSSAAKDLQAMAFMFSGIQANAPVSGTLYWWQRYAGVTLNV